MQSQSFCRAPTGLIPSSFLSWGVALVVLHICRLSCSWRQVGAGGPTAPGGFPVYESVHSYECHTFCAHSMRNVIPWSRRAAGTYSRASSTVFKNV